jgi:UDP-glucose 4-epimerase
MKVVVTGGAGYVGSMVTARLLSAGMSVTVIDKLVYGGEALLPFLTGPDCRLIQGDVRGFLDAPSRPRRSFRNDSSRGRGG